MPVSAKLGGKHFMNPAHMKKAEERGPAPQPKAAPIPPAAGVSAPPMPEDEPHAKIFDHGDGTGHTETADGGYHDHQNIETLKAALQQYFTEEENEGGGPEEAAEQPPPPPSGNPLHGM